MSTWVRGDNGYRFPDPHIFIPAESSKPERVSSYFITWLNFYDVICLAQSSCEHKYLSPSQWRELLLVAFKESRMTFKANSSAERRSKEMDKLLLDWVIRSKVRLTVKSRTTAQIGRETLTVDALPSTKLARSVVYHINELNFRADLRALDGFMHIAPPSKRKVSREDILSSCFPEWVKGIPGGDFISVGDSDGFHGLAASTVHERREYILQLAKLMSTWRGVPATISGPVATQSPFIDVERLERECAAFFAQSFFDRFGRAPVVPCYLDPSTH